MKLSENDFKNYTAILREELIPAMGCTEPIAIAYAAGEGIVEKDVEETIKNMGYIGRVGMKSTDKEILNVMIDKADVDSCL